MICFPKTEKAYNRANILKRLKIKDGTPAGRHAAQSFDMLAQLAFADMEMTVCYSIRDNDLDLGAGNAVAEGCEKLVVCFVSSSRRIIRTILDLMDRNRFMDAYILNELVNDILFTVSDQINMEIEERMRRDGLKLSAMISPGEQGVEMKYQETLLNALKAEAEIPAELNDRYMIDPEKSILYAFGAGRDIEAVPIEHDCANCSLTSCYYRER